MRRYGLGKKSIDVCDCPRRKGQLMMQGMLWAVIGMVVCLTVMCALMMGGMALFRRHREETHDRTGPSAAR